MENYRFKRIFVLVMDSLGIGYMSDADKYFNGNSSDKGANTLLHIANSLKNGLSIPTLNKLGIGDLDNIKGTNIVKHPHSYILKSNEKSVGKDTMTGHFEMMGVYTTKPYKTFTDNGFPKELIKELENKTGHKIIGNKAASGTAIIKELGEEQMKDNALIVYTSADSVLQIAAHEEVTGLNELYRCCMVAREICMQEEYKVGRIIARPYIGENKNNFKRVVAHRHDLALKPDVPTVMNILQNNNFNVSCIGKISDIFDGYGVNESQKTGSNYEGMIKTINEARQKDYKGLCFINLVEFDSEYGHRRDVKGYAKAIEEFDTQLEELISVLKNDDLLIITADHGNDPTWDGTDHTREKVPLIIYNKKFKYGRYLKTRETFADIGATILKNFHLDKPEYLLGEAINELFTE